MRVVPRFITILPANMLASACRSKWLKTDQLEVSIKWQVLNAPLIWWQACPSECYLFYRLSKNIG